ncbi:MAG: sulfatase [Bacteroidales bacterium]|nr:sulfatase [Bacteroidales bacterium]
MKNKLLPFVVGTAILPGMTSCSQNSHDEYNVLFIGFDDLNDYVSILKDFPGIRTPNLDNFANSAVTFTNAYCAAPKSGPSRTALLTGIAPYKSGVYTNEDHWIMSEQASAAVALPEAFRARNYTTLWAGKIFHDLSCPSAERLTSMWDEMAETTIGEWSGSTSLVPYAANNYQEIGVDSLSDSVFADVRNADRIRLWLRKRYDKPFFIAAGIIRPHRPWTAPGRFFDMYPLDSIKTPDLPSDDLDDLPTEGLKYALSETEADFRSILQQGKWKETLQAYMACITFADETFGKIIRALDESPYKDNTIVIVWADHGYHVGEKQRIGKATLWEQASRNILMVRIPGMKNAGTRCNQPVSLLDIYPTLSDYCNLGGITQSLDGISLRKLIENPSMETGRSIVTTWRKDCYSIRDKSFRYIRYSGGGEELYNHEMDPGEFVNLADETSCADEIQRLKELLPTDSTEPVGPAPEWYEWDRARRSAK